MAFPIGLYPSTPTKHRPKPTPLPKSPFPPIRLPSQPASPAHPQSSPSHTLPKPATPPSQPPASTLTLSRSASNNLAAALKNGLAPRTHKTYEQGVKSFLAFCDRERIAPDTRVPASENLLCAFAADGVGRLASSTVNSAINGVRAWHIELGLSWQGGVRLARTIKGVGYLAPASSTRPPRIAFRAHMLETLVNGLDLTDSFDAAVAATAACALWGQARLSELIPDSTFAFDASELPLRRHLAPTSPSGRSRLLHLPRTKTNRRNGDQITITKQAGLANPLPLLANHVQRNNPAESSPLFSYRQKGSLAILSKKHFMRRCNEILQAAGIPKVSGHCFRIGGTTELLLAGVNSEVVKKLGRWESDAFLKYWRELQNIGELHATDIARN